MPAGPGEEAERFADAVEQGRSPGFFGDDDLAQELEIVAMLRSRGAAYAPDPQAKAKAKQRLMAVLAGSQDPQPAPGFGRDDAGSAAVTELLQLMTPPRQQAARPAAEELVDDGGAVTGAARTTSPAGARPARRKARHSMPSRPAGRSGSSRRPAVDGIGRRFVLVASATLVMALALAGTGTLASRDALPGDSLYGVKRVAESAGLALTFDEVAKAQRHFELATTRLDEVERLLAEQPPASPELVAAAIQQFDQSTGEGARMLLASENAGADPVALEKLRSWAAAQSARLAEFRPALPAGPEADQAMKLLDRLVGRTEALADNSTCGIAVPDSVDDLGPVPTASACTRPAPGQAARGSSPAAPGGNNPSGSAEGSSTPTDPTTTDTDSPDPRSSTGTGPSTRRGTPTTVPAPIIPLPDLGPPAEPSTEGGSTDGGDGGGDTTEPDPDASDPTTTSQDPPDDGGDQGGGGLPLLPPVNLPPLLPGLPGISL